MMLVTIGIMMMVLMMVVIEASKSVPSQCLIYSHFYTL